MSPLLDQSALTDLAERLVAAARRAGADAADALAVRSVSLAVEVREGAVEAYERSEGDDVGLRAFVGRRQAVVSTNDVKADVTALAERAVAMAKVAPEDPFAGLADPARLARDVPDLDLPEKVGRTAGERTVERLNPRKVKSKRVPVVFDRRVAGSLIGHLANAINGAAVARKTSFLRDRRGERLFRPGIHVIDDPRRLRGLRSRPFDAEGVATKQLAVVEDGVLAAWLLDCATARELGLRTTGHAQRGVSSTPAPGPSNLHLTAGNDTPEALMADIAEGFYVTDLIGVGVNYVTGDYSRGASGFWIENGECSYPVSEVTIAGNLIDMFQALFPANDLEFRFGTNAPTVRVEGLTVAGR